MTQSTLLGHCLLRCEGQTTLPINRQPIIDGRSLKPWTVTWPHQQQQQQGRQGSSVVLLDSAWMHASLLTPANTCQGCHTDALKGSPRGLLTHALLTNLSDPRSNNFVWVTVWQTWRGCDAMVWAEATDVPCTKPSLPWIPCLQLLRYLCVDLSCFQHVMLKSRVQTWNLLHHRSTNIRFYHSSGTVRETMEDSIAFQWSYCSGAYIIRVMCQESIIAN